MIEVTRSEITKDNPATYAHETSRGVVAYVMLSGSGGAEAICKERADGTVFFVHGSRSLFDRWTRLSADRPSALSAEERARLVALWNRPLKNGKLDYSAEEAAWVAATERRMRNS